VKVSLRLKDTALAEVDRLAETDGVDRSEMLRRLLQIGLARRLADEVAERPSGRRSVRAGG
jgi:metal-responsive CopG/Arc/MetJ family transcriptional regulator